MPKNEKTVAVYHTFVLPDGTKKKKKFYGHSMREAKLKRDKAISDFAKGSYLVSPNMTVAQYAEKWSILRNLDKEQKSRLNRHCTSLIGSLEVQQVVSSNIEECYNQTAGTSKSNIGKTVALIRAMFRSMLADRIISYNPCDTAKRPDGTDNERRALTKEEEKYFLQEIQNSLDQGRWYDIFWGIMYACGLRPGEVRALPLTNICLKDEPFIRVTQACKNKTQDIGLPKTKAGVRTVPIPDWFVPLLKQAISQRKSSSLFLFSNKNGKPVSHSVQKKRWAFFFNRMQVSAGAELYRNKIVSFSLKVGQDITPYYLRHTYCTNLVYVGIPEIVAMKWMGHDDPNMIRKIYSHVNEKIMKQSVERMNNFSPLENIS